MSAISAAERDSKEEHPSSEPSSQQDSSQARKGRKAKRPEREIYRPPPAHGGSGRGGGDGASPRQRDVDKSVSNERREPRKAHLKQEETPPDRQHDIRKDQQRIGVKKSYSDVGQDQAVPDTPSSGYVGRGRDFRDIPPSLGSASDRRGSGGQVARGGAVQIYRRGGGSIKKSWQQSSERYGGEKSDHHQRYDQQRSDAQYARGFRHQRQEQPRSKVQRQHGSHENLASLHSAVNGGALVPLNGSGRRTMEFTNSGVGILGDEAWKRDCLRLMGVERHRVTANRNEVEEHNKSEQASAYSKEAVVAPYATSSPLHVPEFSNQVDSAPRVELSAAIAALDVNQEANLSWGDEMDLEDRRRLANEGAATSADDAYTAPPPVDRNSLSRNAETSNRTRGIIPLTAAVESALNRSENRRYRGRGWNHPAGPLQRNAQPSGRGGGRPMPRFAFPKGREVGGGGWSQSIRFNAPDSRDPYSSTSSRGRGRMIPVAPAPPGFADREGEDKSSLPPHLVQRIVNIEHSITQLAGVLSAGHFRKAEIDQLLTCSNRLQVIFNDVVFTDPTNGEEQRALEHRMWKSAFYLPVETLRSALHANTQGPQSAYCHAALLNLITEGIRFYETLLSEHEKNFGFKLEEHFYRSDDKLTKVLSPGPSNVPKPVKYSLACCQRYLVSMGDLARYREQVNKTQQFGAARNYYSKAAQLAPGNGRAHNQLALLAVYTNRWLDAVFYYVRSLAAKHAFVTARESLISLFDDIRRKVDYYEAGRKRELEQLKKECGAKDRRRSARRLNQREIWKFPDGRVSDVKAEDAEKQELGMLTKVSAQELHKRCIAYLLRSAGILYTKIGMECFDDVAELALIQFRALLALDESPLTSSQLVQLTVIFLFLIHHTSAGETERGVIKAIQNYAILTSFSVFGLLLERLEQLLKSERVLESFNKDLHLMLPSVRIFCIWMTEQNNYKLYSGLPSNIGGLETEKFSVSLWSTLASVCTIIEGSKNDGKLKVVDSRESKAAVSSDVLDAILPEDLYTTAFFDTFGSKPLSYALSKDLNPELAAEHFRLDWLLKLASVLDGYGCEWFTIEDGKYVAPSSRPESPGAGQVRAAASDDEDSSDTDRDSASEQESPGEMSTLQLLQRDVEMKQSALEREGQCRAVVIVEPHQLVVDTNSFIDHRTLIERIVMAKQYKLAVPFVVYNELLGLEKNDDSWVSQQAKASVEMLQEFTKGSLSAYSKYVEAVTSTGTTLSDFDFHRNEEAERLSNDDLILRCCRNLIAAKRDECMVKQEIKNLRYEPITTYQKVVLLTDDKNLRLKAKGDEVPVIGIRTFVGMARLASR